MNLPQKYESPEQIAYRYLAYERPRFVLADAYLALVHKMLRRQAVIDQLKKACGVL